MTIKKDKSVDQQLLEKELFHSGKYGHKEHTSKKAYNRSKVKKELLKELYNESDNDSSNL